MSSVNLDHSYGDETMLKEWYPKVKKNFKILEAMFNSVIDDDIVEETAREYIDKYIKSETGVTAALEQFADAVKENRSLALELDNISSLAYKCIPAADVSALDSYNLSTAMYMADNEMYLHVVIPMGTGVWGNIMAFQVHFAENDVLHRKYVLDTGWTEWESYHLPMKTELSDKIDNKIVLGTYTGDGTATRTINLGFTPCAVEVYKSDGQQTDSGSLDIKGGLALTGKPCGNAIAITENGFTVACDFSKDLHTNQDNLIYYFKAYRDCPIMQIS